MKKIDKNLIGYLYNKHKVKLLHIMLPKKKLIILTFCNQKKSKEIKFTPIKVLFLQKI